MPLIIITGYGTYESAVSALKLNACEYIRKPLELGQVRQSVKNALGRKK